MTNSNDEYKFVDALATAKFFIYIDQRDKANQVLDLMLPFCETIEQLDAIGYVYTKNRNFQRGLEIATKQLPNAQTPEQLWDMRVNLIRGYLNTNQPNQALPYIKLLKSVNPLDQPNLMDEAYALFLLNRKNEAEVILRTILENPESEDILIRGTFNLGSYEIRNGNFKTGLKNFLLSGRKLDIWKTFTLKNRYWEGGAYPGSTLLMMADGGIGDEIVNIRFQKHIKELGMNPVWYTTRMDLADMFIRCGFNVITSLDDVQFDWMWTYGMSVPAYLNVEETDLWYGPYISPTIKRTTSNTKKKIGIKISGNPKYDQDLNRSLPLEPLLQAIPEDYEIYSFHLEDKIEHPRVINWITDDITWDDTLNKIEEMDCIVSSCTSLIHAAGAMGKDAVVITPILKYYLWAKEGVTSPWYGDNLITLHQQEHDDWSHPLNELKELL